MAALKLRSHRTVKQVFDQKMKITLAARTRWPMYASKTEDEQLRDPAWDCKYQGTQPLFWDNTGINLRKQQELYCRGLPTLLTMLAMLRKLVFLCSCAGGWVYMNSIQEQ